MRRRSLASGVLGAVIVAAVNGCLKTGANSETRSAFTTPWSEPDLQGIWTDEYQTPLQRPARFKDREFLTREEQAELDQRRAALQGRDRRGRAGSERDVAGAYNAVFESVKPTGQRTSLVVDPSDGQIPALTPAAQKRLAVYREFQL